MRNIFIPPKNQFADYTAQARFELTWKMFMFNTVFLFFVVFIYYVFESEAFEEALYAWFIHHVLLVFFLKTRRYRLIGFIYSFHAVLFFTYTLNFIPNIIHGIEFFWMIVFVIYTFFAIGRTAGYLLMILAILGLAIYFIYNFEENIITLSQIVRLKPAATVINISVSSLLIAYLVNQFIKLSSVSEKKYREANRELQDQNRLVQAQNEEKTIMLKEIHHRVKNNLQVISSLLRLQSYEIDEEVARTHFQDAVYRVVAMALIHEKMYQNKNLSQIDLKDYLSSLADELVATYSDHKQIKISIDSELEYLGNDSLVPVALIFNELLTNSLKHAFQEVDNGEITVSITKSDQPEVFKLLYRDNGTWSDGSREGSFGLELIATLTEQLDGKVVRTYEDGTRYEFNLKNIR